VRGRLVPVVEKEAAEVGVIVLARVAGAAVGDGLDESATSQKIEDLPDEAGGPEGVAGGGLALGGPPLLGELVVEAKELNVAQLKIGQVGEDVFGELGTEVVGEVTGDIGDGGGDVGAVGLYGESASETKIETVFKDMALTDSVVVDHDGLGEDGRCRGQERGPPLGKHCLQKTGWASLSCSGGTVKECEEAVPRQASLRT
jgi:hypothetical protein